MVKSIFQEMFDNAVHVGHKTQKWNPLMRKFIHGERNGLHIINLEMTEEYLSNATDFLKKLCADGKTVLFVSTKPQAMKLIREMAISLSMPYVDSKWIPGLLTNYESIKSRIRYFKRLKEMEASGEFEKYTKKEASDMGKELQKLEDYLGGVQDMKGVPEAVFVVDVLRDKIVVSEANKLGVPVVAFVDTNVNPENIDYPIPANDDALKSLQFLFGKISEALIKKESKTKIS